MLEPTPTVWTRQSGGSRSWIVATISLSKPMSPSVISTTWRWAPGRSGASASRMPDFISVPPSAWSRSTQASASFLASRVALTGPRFQRYGLSPKQISSR
jgi:hypothetical protein